MKNYKIPLLGLMVFTTSLFGQLDYRRPLIMGEIPDYPVDYTLPKVEEIQETVGRVRDYWIKSTTLQIINRRTGEIITDFSEPNPNAIVDVRFGGFNLWDYTNGVTLSAFNYLHEVTGDSVYLNFNVNFYNFIFDHLPWFRKNNELYGRSACGFRRIIYMEALDHCGSIGCALVKTYMKHEDNRYRSMIDTVDQHISHEQFRLKDGTLARQRPQAKSLWTDDFYMSIPFLAYIGKLTGDKKYYKDAVKQVIQLSDRLFIEEKGLFDHGWNVTSADYDPRFYWGRANGWAMMAMAELLTVLPEDFSGRDKVLHIFRTQVRAVSELQDGTGFWHNMLDKTDTYLETSATAMFCFSIARGINKGWINPVYGPVAQTAWNAVATKVLLNGQVDGTCEGTTFAHDNVYYYNRGASVHASHGYGPVLYAGAEMIKLLQNDKIRIMPARPNSVNSAVHYRAVEE